jgi:hypothetical protein
MQNYHDYERCVNSLPLPIVAKTLHKLGTVYYQAKFYVSQLNLTLSMCL